MNLYFFHFFNILNLEQISKVLLRAEDPSLFDYELAPVIQFSIDEEFKEPPLEELELTGDIIPQEDLD